MKKIFLALALWCCIIAACTAQKNKRADKYEVTQKSVADKLKFLASDELGGRATASEGIEITAKYLEDIFAKNSVKPYFTTYRDTLSNYQEPAYNIVGYLEGNDPELKKEYIILSAHYDHIGLSNFPVAGDSIYNGANDDASGCVAVAEMVNYFARSKSNKRSIMFCFFTAEEKGLYGSRHLAAKLKQADFNLYAMLNFELIGVPLGKEAASYITGYAKSNMAHKLNEYAGNDMLVGSSEFEMRYQLFRRADNYSFYTEFKIPAHTISTTNMETFTLYHHVDDEFDMMDINHMAGFIKRMIPAVEKMANARVKEIVLTE
ncbi:M20/M25/M40 family metallo-hydrolase [Flavobacterium sp. MK4S-17]|uniref:M20/M25/M40 family metallo-hydrolase n=1 Tax=Flavobacterium sp. MK4S-17 TaxID=2543737 RepID=UPI001359621E|nr:M20/M25/M40 family metallo-hydrolase [Flavobacterium sp. MK4S-17]